MTINIGIVGASFAKAAYLPAIKNIHDAKVIAISSFRMDSAKSCAEEFSIPNFYDNWEEMLNSHRMPRSFYLLSFENMVRSVSATLL